MQVAACFEGAAAVATDLELFSMSGHQGGGTTKPLFICFPSLSCLSLYVLWYQVKAAAVAAGTASYHLVGNRDIEHLVSWIRQASGAAGGWCMGRGRARSGSGSWGICCLQATAERLALPAHCLVGSSGTKHLMCQGGRIHLGARLGAGAWRVHTQSQFTLHSARLSWDPSFASIARVLLRMKQFAGR